MLLEHKGETPVCVYYEKRKQTMQLPEAIISWLITLLLQVKSVVGEKNVVLKYAGLLNIFDQKFGQLCYHF